LDDVVTLDVGVVMMVVVVGNTVMVIEMKILQQKWKSRKRQECEDKNTEVSDYKQ
jgi:hypothetical protein